MNKLWLFLPLFFFSISVNANEFLGSPIEQLTLELKMNDYSLLDYDNAIMPASMILHRNKDVSLPLQCEMDGQVKSRHFSELDIECEHWNLEYDIAVETEEFEIELYSEDGYWEYLMIDLDYEVEKYDRPSTFYDEFLFGDVSGMSKGSEINLQFDEFWVKVLQKSENPAHNPIEMYRLVGEAFQNFIGQTIIIGEIKHEVDRVSFSLEQHKNDLRLSSFYIRFDNSNGESKRYLSNLSVLKEVGNVDSGLADTSELTKRIQKFMDNN